MYQRLVIISAYLPCTIAALQLDAIANGDEPMSHKTAACPTSPDLKPRPQPLNQGQHTVAPPPASTDLIERVAVLGYN
jgi:hypothetical protein